MDSDLILLRFLVGFLLDMVEVADSATPRMPFTKRTIPVDDRTKRTSDCLISWSGSKKISPPLLSHWLHLYHLWERWCWCTIHRILFWCECNGFQTKEHHENTLIPKSPSSWYLQKYSIYRFLHITPGHKFYYEYNWPNKDQILICSKERGFNSCEKQISEKTDSHNAWKRIIWATCLLSFVRLSWRSRICCEWKRNT